MWRIVEKIFGPTIASRQTHARKGLALSCTTNTGKVFHGIPISITIRRYSYVIQWGEAPINIHKISIHSHETTRFCSKKKTTNSSSKSAGAMAHDPPIWDSGTMAGNISLVKPTEHFPTDLPDGSLGEVTQTRGRSDMGMVKRGHRGHRKAWNVKTYDETSFLREI